jgi:hypothetical protein
VLSFASSAQTNFAVSPTCKVNVDKISAVKTSSIDVVPKTGWANGQGLCISEQFAPLLKNLADGEALLLDESLYDADILEDIAMLMNESVLMLLPPDEA